VSGNPLGNKLLGAAFRKLDPAINPAVDSVEFLINDRLFM
jgi:hypothetical protein